MKFSFGYSLLLVYVFTAISCSNSNSKLETKKTLPNVVFFLVDDLGWRDAACYGSEIYQTPTIDKLAKDGMLFTQSYASNPLCVGSRYSIMSGKYPARNKPTKEFGTMAPSEVTFAESFKEAGYTTFFAGKWHLGKKGAYPEDQGFDTNIAGHHMGAPASYFYPYGNEGNIRRVPGLQKDGHQGDYLTDVLTDKTVEFIIKNKNKPFLAFLSHYVVHTPLESKEKYKQEHEKIIKNYNFNQPAYNKVKDADEKLRQDNASYAGMIKSIDESLAKIINTLDELGLTENTIIVFTSDNGGMELR